MSKKFILLWIWVIFNIFIGLYEIYCYLNRYKLSLNNFPKWNLSIISSWNEYCKVDPRYALKKYQYVWNFELLNAFYAFILIFIILFNKKLIKYILFLEIISCTLYFLTLLFEFFRSNDIKYNIINNSTICNRIIYYGISSIWIFIPLYLFIKFIR